MIPAIRTVWVRLVCAASILAVLAGSTGAQELQKVTIAPSTSSLPASGARIAKQLGLFQRHGLDASVTPMDSGSIATMALISKSVEFTTSSPTDVILSQSRGQDMIAVTSIYRGIAAVLIVAKPTADKLAVPAGAPIDQRLKALNGLTVATPSATSVFTLALKGAAESVGAKVNFVYMDQQAMVAALRTGAIQAFMASSPYYGLPLVDGSGVMWINGPKQEFPPQFTPANAVTLNVMRSFATARPDVVQRAIATFEELGRAVKERPADVKAAIAKVFPNLEPGTLDVLFETEAAGYDTKPLDVAAMSHELEFLKSTGVNVPRIASLDPADMLLKK